MRLKSLATLAVMILSFVGAIRLSAQGMDQKLPIDPQVRIGKLSNGLTYFIRKNAEPANRAEFYIAQRVGSMQEEEPQRGLAHFLEHMCFNGTKNFPDKGIINYLETYGVRFGYNINAYTAFDKTVYTLMDVPTDKGTNLLDSSLLILHDWSGFVTLADEEIDKERGVIHEEWRQGRNAQMRMLENILPRIYPNNRYGERLPIGLMSVVDNFDYQTLRDYYHKWYHPDLQAIIVVGDIDPDYIEAQIKKTFADIPAKENPAERVYFQVEDNEEPIVAMAYDKEATSTDVSIMYKYDVPSMEEKGTIQGLLVDYVTTIASRMINARFDEILNKPNAPFLNAYGSLGNYFVAFTKGAVDFSATAREGELLTATEALVHEIARIKEHGFTAGEYDRARTNFLKSYENSYNERDKRKNKSYADEYAQYFTEGGYIPGIEVEKQMFDMLAPNIPVDVINEFMKQTLTEKNNVLMVMAPQKEGLSYPSEAEFLAAYKKYFNDPVEPYKDAVSDQKLMEKTPKAGKVKSTKDNQQFGTTLITLSNGVKVYVKTTDFKNNEIRMSMVKPGGLNQFNNPADLNNVKFFNQVFDLGGLAEFDAVALPKVLTGRSVGVAASVGETDTYISGSSTKEDLETMLQLLYLQVTANRKDAEAFKAYVQKQTEALKNQEANPMISFSDSLIYALYGNDPLKQRALHDDVAKIDYDRVLEMYNQIFADVHDATFFFVGNVDAATLKPLLETYVASLPAKKNQKNNRFLERTNGLLSGSTTIDYKKDLSDATATVFIGYTGKVEYNLKNELMMEIMGALLSNVYLETVREAEGGTYGVSAMGQIADNPEGEAIFQIFYQTGPDKVDHLNKIIYKGLDEFIQNGPDKVFFDKTILNMKKDFQESVRENGFWMGILRTFFYDGRDNYSAYEQTLESITPADIQAFAKKLVEQNNKKEVIIRSTKMVNEDMK